MHAHHQYNFVTDKMLVSGEFDAGRYKVLILPHALCLSPKAIATVRRFAENGGTVIADTRPAFYDDHCHPYERAALDDLFGIKGGFQPGVSTNVAIVGKLGLEDLKWAPDGTANDRKVIIDPTVVLTTGQALGKGGETPVCIVNTVGKGRAILLNLVVRSSVPVREYEGNLNAKPNLDSLPGDAARFFLGLMNEARVERAFNFMEYKNEKVPFFTNVRVQRWKSGEYQIAGFFRQTDVQVRHGSFIPGGEKWPVSPQRKASGRPYPPLPWVYDLKNGLTVGPATWFITQIKPGRASIYALLPGPVPPMFVETPKQARRGAPLALKVSVPEARGLHAIKLRALLPDGRSAELWDQSIMVSKEPKTVVLPLAWNDPAGTWMITFTDLFSTDTAQRVPLAVE